MDSIVLAGLPYAGSRLGLALLMFSEMCTLAAPIFITGTDMTGKREDSRDP